MQDTVEVNALTGNGTITHNTEVAALSSMSWFENTSKSSKTSLFVAANNPLENAFPHADDQFPEDVVSDYFTICRVHDIYPYPETTTVGLTVGRANAVRVRISRQTLIDDGYADTLDGFKKWIEDKDLKVAYLTTQPTTEAYQANSLLASSSGTVSLTGGYTAGTLTASTVQAQLSASAG